MCRRRNDESELIAIVSWTVETSERERLQLVN